MTSKYPFNVCDTDCYKISVCFIPPPPLPFYHTLLTNIEVDQSIALMTITVVSCHKKLTTPIQRKVALKGRGISAISIEFQQNPPSIPTPPSLSLIVSLLWFPRNVTITIIDSKCHLKYELA